MAVITRVADLKAKKSICDDLLSALIERNYPAADAPSITNIRAQLWVKVFANGWTTNSANPAPAPLRKRKIEETALYVGTLNEDVPIKSKGKIVPEYRRARAPVQFKASFAFGGKLDFYWIDDEGQKVPSESVDIEGDMSYEEIKGMVANYYDQNEMERVGEWNWAKAVHWARARITTIAVRTTSGVGVIGRPQPVPDVQEDVSELQQVRLVEQYLKEQDEQEETA
ncbi:hypothetical protein CkaCkLH20_12982 [Colletotrichum karsti]|uniref:Uncharacterized protein n=1 Tax=Colletotrichum karsti TaxID=1095194 RepID=A0A9P6HT12_9PEZI|nr:uncharacterized protein CkaCkLH20_12982 [Colletotrichum karsti]KAF9869589.1 hypothetical protein CkaCkLH20_12982 [Colletotrichum karsti]